MTAGEVAVAVVIAIGALSTLIGFLIVAGAIVEDAVSSWGRWRDRRRDERDMALVLDAIYESIIKTDSRLDQATVRRVNRNLRRVRHDWRADA